MRPPVRRLILHDDPSVAELPHHRLLRETAAGRPALWRLAETTAVPGWRADADGVVEIYELADADQRPPGEIVVDLTPVLGRELQKELND